MLIAAVRVLGRVEQLLSWLLWHVRATADSLWRDHLAAEAAKAGQP